MNFSSTPIQSPIITTEKRKRGRPKGTSATKVVKVASERILNEKAVKEFALQYVRDKKAGKFKRVGKCFIEKFRASAIATLVGMINAHPTKGKTLKA